MITDSATRTARSRWTWGLVVVGGLAMFGLLGGLWAGRPVAGAAASAPAAPLDCAAWQMVPSPNGGTADNGLSGVSAVSATEIWAVGAYTASNGLAQTLVERGDGSSWTIVASPNAGTGDNALAAVSARASGDVWAVGQYRPTPGANLQTLIEHWNGSAWSVVSSPNGNSSVDNHLLGVVAISATDAWAVGYYTTSLLPLHSLALHWNGATWSVSGAPAPGLSSALSGVAALSSSDVWAVGAYAVDLSGNGHTLVAHWTGSSWSQVSSPSPGTSSALAAVAPVAANDIWAVGVSSDGTRYLTLAEHWNGSAWSQVTTPSFSTGDNALGSLAVRGASDIWAVGGYGTGTGTSSTLALHWDGAAWTPAPSDNPSNASNALLSVTNAGADTWAVGTDGPAGTHVTLTERLISVPCATATATSTPPPPTATNTAPPSATPVPPSETPAPTQTPGGPSATPVPPSNTPAPTSTPGALSATPTATPGGATATPCALSFGDVHPTDYFYESVLYLACHGVISGYGDGTFRPYNQTTRAQMVKIVVLGFARPITTPAGGAHTFADVPSGAPFFDVIETAAGAGIVNGYACGGPNEPCDDQHRPYFRPNANVTRGQLSKIDAVAAGWPLLNPPSGTFADVAPGSAFYQFVETAACRGVISGYTCGGPGEPCDGDHRPYFRQGNSATRGQIAKIVYLSITGAGSSCPAATQ